MKKRNKIWLNIVYILFGALVSYLLCQFEYLNIDTKVNISSSLISLITAAIGLYLAISLKKIQTKSTNLHNYLQPKLDIVWKYFLTFSHNLNLNDSIPLSEVTKSIKEISQNITPLKKMFEAFDLNDNSIDDLETAIEKFEIYLVDKCEINGNIINYTSNKSKIKIKLDEIHTLFVVSLKAINKIS